MSGKYERASAKRNAPHKKARRLRKEFVLLCCAVTLVVGMVGGSLAFLVTNTEPVKNVFTPANVGARVDEDFHNNIKNDVKVTNTGNTDAYIRATVIVNWVDKDGNVKPAEEGEYTAQWPGNGWTKGAEGYYYHTNSVGPNQSTGVLLTNCQPVEGKAPEGYTLSVEILAQAIQAKPFDSYSAAWAATN